MCAYRCAQPSYTTQHGAVLIIFPLYLQTTTIAQMLCIGGEREGSRCSVSWCSMNYTPTAMHARAQNSRSRTPVQFSYCAVNQPLFIQKHKLFLRALICRKHKTEKNKLC